MVTAGLIGLNATAIKALLEGEPSLKAVSRYWAQLRDRQTVMALPESEKHHGEAELNPNGSQNAQHSNPKN